MQLAGIFLIELLSIKEHAGISRVGSERIVLPIILDAFIGAMYQGQEVSDVKVWTVCYAKSAQCIV